MEKVAEADITDATVYDGLLAEATYKGKGSSHAARVSAWDKIANLRGMNKTPDLGAWAGVTTLRLQIVVGNTDGPVQDVTALLEPHNEGTGACPEDK